MQVILLEPVPALGDRGEIVNVATGYARNYLLPKKLAALVSKAAAEQAEANKRRAAKVEADQRAALKQRADRLAAASCTISAAVTEEGHLYGSVGPAEIAASLVKEGFEVTEAMVKLPDHIKDVGVYPVVVALTPEVEATVKVWVVKE